MAAATGPVPTREKGAVTARTSGIGQGWFWWSDETEETPELVWPKSVEKYDAMRRQDAQVVSVLRAVTLPIRRTPWRIDPNGAPDDVVRWIADDLGLPIAGQEPEPRRRSASRFSWAEHLQLALTMLPFGHSFFEQTYALDEARGLYHLRKLGWRPPRTISEIDVAADGGLVGIKQNIGKGELIPVSQLVAYINDREGGNWLGTSLLRPAYKFWMLKDRALRTQSQVIERNGLGIPVYEQGKPPEGLPADKALAWLEADMAAGLDVAQAWRAGDTAGAAAGSGGKFRLVGVEGTLPDAEKVIRYYDEQIARAVLAHFLNLGSETGSWALGSTFADFFTLSLQTIALQIADVATQHIVEDLVDINWGPDVPAPRIVHDEIGARHPATAEAIKALIESKALTPDAELESAMRTAYGLPARGSSDIPTASPADLAQIIQKIYLGVDKVVTDEEARAILNRAGAGLTGSLPTKADETNDPPAPADIQDQEDPDAEAE